MQSVSVCLEALANEILNFLATPKPSSYIHTHDRVQLLSWFNNKLCPQFSKSEEIVLNHLVCKTRALVRLVLLEITFLLLFIFVSFHELWHSLMSICLLQKLSNKGVH